MSVFITSFTYSIVSIKSVQYIVDALRSKLDGVPERHAMQVCLSRRLPISVCSCEEANADKIYLGYYN